MTDKKVRRKKLEYIQNTGKINMFWYMKTKVTEDVRIFEEYN